MSSLIGSISLNISFVLYLFLYLPQILHNRKSENIANLSYVMHLLLLISYFFDLLYGFASHLQWQYKTVSVVGLLLMVFQHLQLIRFFRQQKKAAWVDVNLFILLIAALGVYYFFGFLNAGLSVAAAMVIGTISRICFVIYSIPQIVKNNKLKMTNGISVKFIWLNLTLSVLDFISAWCLDWGWPNKLSAPVMVVLMSVMLWQRSYYQDVTAYA